MPGAAELEAVVVRLTANAQQYDAVLNGAEKKITATANFIEQKQKRLMAAQAAAMEEAARLTQAAAGPTEIYAQQVKKLAQHHNEGRISLQTWNRGMVAANQLLPSVQAAQARCNQEMQRAAALTQAVTTPTQRYGTALRELNHLARQGLITQETYSRNLARLQAQLPAAAAATAAAAEAQRRFNSVQQEGQSILLRYETMLERQRREVQLLSAAYQQGAITQAQYYGGLQRMHGETFTRMGQQMATFGRQMSMFVTVPLIGIGVMAERSFSKFESGLANLNAAAGPTAAQLEQINKAAIDTSKSLGTGPSRVVESFTELTKAGMKVEDVLAGAGKQAVMFAKVGELQVGHAAVVMSDAMNIFGERSESAGNILSAAADSSSTSIQKIVESFNQAAQVSRSSGLSMRETAAVIAMLANNGLKASDAGTSMRTALLRLAAPEKQAMEQMEKYGVKMRDATGEMKPFAERIDELTNKLGGLSSEAKAVALKEMFGQDAIRFAEILMKEGSKGFENMLSTMDKARTVGEKYAIIQNTIAGRWERMRGSIERLGIAIWEAFGSRFTSALDSITRWLDSAAEWIKLNPALTSGILAVASALAILGPLIFIGGKIMGTVGAVLSLTTGIYSFAASIPTLVTSLEFAYVASNALKFGLIGLGIGGIAVASQYLYSYVALSKDFNDSLVESTRLEGELQQILAKRQKNVMAEGAGIDDVAKRKAFYAGELESAIQYLEGVHDNVKQAQDELQKVNDAQWSVMGVNIGGREEIVAAEQKVTELKARREQAISAVQELTGATQQAIDAGDKAAAAIDNVVNPDKDKKAEKLAIRIANLTEKLKMHAEQAKATSNQDEILSLKQAGASEEQLKAAREYAAQIDSNKQADKVRDLTEAIERELGDRKELTNMQKIEKLAQEGLNAAKVQELKLLEQRRQAFVAQKKHQEKIDAAVKATQTPLEKYNETLKLLEEATKQGDLTSEQFTERIRKLHNELAKDMTIKFKTDGLDAVLWGGAEMRKLAAADQNLRLAKQNIPGMPDAPIVNAPIAGRPDLDFIHNRTAAENRGIRGQAMAGKTDFPGWKVEGEGLTRPQDGGVEGLLEKIAENTDPERKKATDDKVVVTPANFDFN